MTLPATGNQDPATQDLGKGNPPSGDGDKTDYKAAYKGLQPKYEKLKTDFETLETKYNELVATHDEAKKVMGTKAVDAQKLQDQITALTNSETALKADAGKKDRTIARMKLIMTDYPDLADMEGQGLLPEAPDDAALKVILDKARTVLDKRVGQSTKKKLEGSNPDDGKRGGSTPPPTESIDLIWTKMSEALKKNDQAAYLEWRDKYDLALEAANKT